MEQIINQFNVETSSFKIEPFGTGHINDTFRIINENLAGKDYLLQKINHTIFKDVGLLMNNINLVTEHIRKKISASSELYGNQNTLTLVRTKTDQLYYKDQEGSYWRTFEFLKGYKAYDIVDTSEQAYQGGFAFGNFLVLLDDFPVHTIKETIPSFHDIGKRLETFKETFNNQYQERHKECKSLIDYVLELGDQMCTIENLRKKGEIRDRVTHNDTKFNNVLLREDGKGSCVIDLDTIMPGIVHYDFGDGIRTSAATASEDEADLKLVSLDIDKFKAFSEGYLDVTREVLQPIEIKYLALSGPLFSYIMGVRFLTDYLSGDHYYKTAFEGHNLQRAKCQLEFTKRMMERLPDMEAVIAKYS